MHSRNHCCNRNATISVCIVELQCHCQEYGNTDCCTKMLLWRTYVAGNNKTYIHRHVKHPIFLYNIKQIWIFSTDFHTVPHIQFRENLFSGSRNDTCRQKDGNDKANRRFHDYANAPKNVKSELQWSSEATVLATDAVTALPPSSLDLREPTFSLCCSCRTKSFGMCRLRCLVKSYRRIEVSSFLYLQGEADQVNTATDCVEELFRRKRQPVTVKRLLISSQAILRHVLSTMISSSLFPSLFFSLQSVQLTYYMRQSVSREDNIFSANEKFPRFYGT